MLKRKHLIVLVIGICVAGSACKKEGPIGPVGPAGPQGPAYKGVVSGNMLLYDEYGERLYNNVNGITVTLKSGISQRTDSNGHFLFTDVTTGNYIIRAFNDGFGATAVPNVSFISDTFYQEVKNVAKAFMGCV